MTTTTMKAFSLESLSVQELEQLAKDVHQEMNNRQEKECRIAWQKVVNAVAEYMDIYGDIIINIDNGEAEYYIEDLGQLEEDPGVIMV